MLISPPLAFPYSSCVSLFIGMTYDFYDYRQAGKFKQSLIISEITAAQGSAANISPTVHRYL
jgi:hypothetical protein